MFCILLVPKQLHTLDYVDLTMAIDVNFAGYSSTLMEEVVTELLAKSKDYQGAT